MKTVPFIVDAQWPLASNVDTFRHHPPIPDLPSPFSTLPPPNKTNSKIKTVKKFFSVLLRDFSHQKELVQL